MRRSLFGYRRSDVGALLAARDGALTTSAGRLEAAQGELERRAARIVELELVADRLSDCAITGEREAAEARDALARAVAERDQALDELATALANGGAGAALRVLEAGYRRRFIVKRTATPTPPVADVAPASAAEAVDTGAGEGAGPVAAPVRVAEDVFVGVVELDVGPLEDFAGLVELEDAIAGLAATASVSVVRFAQGRATLALKLREPVTLADALAERSRFVFRVREAGPDRIALDVVA